ncbi:hypothetical protein [Manganibacter manganicus]|uniref:hypothetical protein n=1 Tax=Manganibacter manganicus TaxID=1873176 RepID=UPI001FDA71B2|nr:hypothetical protein [Pseudaminobacter manganicus]
MAIRMPLGGGVELRTQSSSSRSLCPPPEIVFDIAPASMIATLATMQFGRLCRIPLVTTAGLRGILLPSLRHAGGINLVIFLANLVDGDNITIPITGCRRISLRGHELPGHP